MSAFFIATVSIKDNDKFREYAQKAGETMTAFGGEVITRGEVMGTLAGHANHQAVGVVKFPDMASLDNWYSSKAYQAIITLREEAADMTIIKYAIPG